MGAGAANVVTAGRDLEGIRYHMWREGTAFHFGRGVREIRVP